MTLVKDNSVQAINTALLSVKRDISALTATKSTCEPSGNPSSGSTDETTAGLEPGKTYNINISGNAATATRATSATSATTADKATTATTANHAETATTATTAETATNANHAETATTAGNADTVDNYHASDLWRSDGATWNPGANVFMTPSGNSGEWSFDFRNKNGKTGSYWQVWDENKQTLLRVDADGGKVSAPYGFVGNLSGKADSATKLEDATTKVPYISKRTGNKKILVKVGSFPDGAEVSFLLTIKRTDGKGFTGFLTINSHSVFDTYNGLNGIKSSYDMFQIRGGELVFLYRNSDNSTDVYMNLPSYASMYMLIFMPKSYSDIELKEVSGFSGTLLDKF